MKETLNQAYKAVKKFGDSIDRTYIEVRHQRTANHDGSIDREEFWGYVPDCGYQIGTTVKQMIDNLKQGWVEYQAKQGIHQKRLLRITNYLFNQGTMKKHFIVEYDFLNTRCSFETTSLSTFNRKLDWIEEQAEIVQSTVDIRTEERAVK